MEMEENLEQDWLDARLRDEAPYIDDAGFTSSVLKKLPARPVRRSYRALILIGLTIAACLVAYWLSGGSSLLIDSFASVAMLPVTTMWIIAALAGSVVMAAGLAAAVSRAGGRSR
jgi:fatty acid desaturase